MYYFPHVNLLEHHTIYSRRKPSGLLCVRNIFFPSMLCLFLFYGKSLLASGLGNPLFWRTVGWWAASLGPQRLPHSWAPNKPPHFACEIPLGRAGAAGEPLAYYKAAKTVATVVMSYISYLVKATHTIPMSSFSFSCFKVYQLFFRRLTVMCQGVVFWYLFCLEFTGS